MSTHSNAADKFTGDYKFNGGIRLRGYKKISTDSPIVCCNPVDKYTLPLQQHLGAPLSPLVAVGDYVLKGQVLATSDAGLSSCVNSPTSGKVSAIEERVVPHPSGLKDLCLEISADGKDQWISLNPVGDNFRDYTPHELTKLLRRSGIVGLGGAVFPTSVKIQAGMDSTHKIHTLIINAAECEPWISCDQALMQEKADEIAKGIEIALYISGATSCLIGIEDDKPEAIDAVEQAIMAAVLPATVVTVPAIYPTGGERQLIKVLTNLEVPADGYPADIGMLVLNVATAWSIRNYIQDGHPLISRIVTVTGDGVRNPCNMEALIGTPIHHLIQQAGGYSDGVSQLTMGGPMMGFALPNDELPVVKATNCLLAETASSLAIKPDAMACIRCGACAEVCPADLLPQQLYWYSRAKKLDVLKTYRLQNCIECGCCDYVCPSHIPLVHYFRYAKAEIRKSAVEQLKSDQARVRHEAREARLERIKQEKAAKLAAKKAALEAKKKNQPDDKKAAIAEALERAKKRKEALKKQSENNPDQQTGRSENKPSASHKTDH